MLTLEEMRLQVADRMAALDSDIISRGSEISFLSSNLVDLQVDLRRAQRNLKNARSRRITLERRLSAATAKANKEK